MTAPKRWYQLSMLQLLAATAVLAGSIYLNVRVAPIGEAWRNASARIEDL